MKSLCATAAVAALAVLLGSPAHAGRAYIGTYTPNLADPQAYANEIYLFGRRRGTGGEGARRLCLD